MAGNDLTLATRELFLRSVKNQVYMKMPFLEEIINRHQVKYSGGRYIERLVIKDEMEDLGQAYTANEALTDETKDMLEKPRFTWKYYQMPMRYDIDEETQNAGAGNEEQLLDLADFLVTQAQRGIKIALQRMLFNVNPTTGAGSETGVADSSKFFQSLLSALGHDVTYGTLTRSLSAGTNAWWQGADPAGTGVTSSSQNTAVQMSIQNLRKWIIPIMEYMESMSDLYIMMCPTLFNKLRAEVESFRSGSIDKESVRHGVTKLRMDDGHQIVSVPWLEKGYGTSGTTENWVFLLNLSDWELRIHTKRNFKMTDFKWQGEVSNGYDRWLARILLSGNYICWKPNGNMWLQNAS